MVNADSETPSWKVMKQKTPHELNANMLVCTGCDESGNSKYEPAGDVIAQRDALLAAAKDALSTLEHVWPLIKDRADFQPQLRAAIAACGKEAA